MANPSYNYFQLTGDTLIDATTHGFYWGLDTGRTIDWSISNGLDNETWNNPGVVASYVNAMLGTFSYFANIKFNYLGYFTTPIVAAQGGSEINVSISASTTMFPSSSFWAVGNFNSITSTDYSGQVGDIYLNLRSQANTLTSYEPGSAGWFVAIHEIGHTLGLKHPHDDGGTGRPTYSQLGFSTLGSDWASIMSYSDDYAWNLKQWDPATPMILDVIALQYIYGKNMATNAGDSTHKLSQTNFYSTIWDSSGSDTISVAGSIVGWTITLPNIQISPLVDTKVGEAFPSLELALASPKTLYWLTGDIENVIGGSGNDKVSGSDGANSLSGGSGNDTLYGGGGNDTFDWDTGTRTGSDIFYGGTGNDTYVLDSQQDTVIEYSSEGVDTVWVPFSYSVANLPYVETVRGFGVVNIWLIGNAGANTISGSTGSDIIDGGASTDTALYYGNRTNYTISKVSAGWTVSSTAEGVDTLTNIERLKFADTAIAYDTSGVGGQTYRVYKAAFNRTPDVGGLGFWISGMDGGVSLNAVAQGFVNSAEFKTVYGASPTNAQIVTRFYDNVLGRAADSGGYNFWLGNLDSGQSSVAQVLASFSESSENQAAVIGVIENGILYTPYG